MAHTAASSPFPSSSEIATAGAHNSTHLRSLLWYSPHPHLRPGLAEWPDQSAVFGLRASVAVASDLFQLVAVEDSHPAPRRSDHARAFQHMQRDCHAAALRAHHDRHELVGEGDVVAVVAVATHEQPAGQSRLDLVAGVRHVLWLV